MPVAKGASAARITLLTGGSLQGYPELTNQSADCSGITNLQTQVGPYIASTACQLGILKLLKPLITIIKGLPNPPPQAIQQFSKAAADLEPCFASATSTAVVPFVRDLICLQIRSLKCFLANLQSVDSAVAVQNVLDSYQPIIGLMELAAELFQVAGIKLPDAPKLAPGVDPGSLSLDQNAVSDYVAALEVIADSVGGC